MADLAMMRVGLAALFVGLATAVAARVTNHALNVVTGVLLLGAIGALLLLVVELIVGRRSGAGALRAKLWLLIVTSVLMLTVVELALRAKGTYANYHERNGNADYRSIYWEEISRYRVYDAQSEIGWTQAEFVHKRRTNALGLPDREFDLGARKQPAEFRVIAIGDSFTEGVGTAYDTTWVKVFEKTLAAQLRGRTPIVLNAGVGGSDVYYGYSLLKDKLLAFDPDLVVVVVNNSDVTDITIRGGEERLETREGASIRKTGPPWEWLYAVSYVFRHAIHDGLGYNWLLQSAQQSVAEERAATARIRQCLDAFVRLGTDRHFEVLVAFNPHEYEVAAGHYAGLFQDLVAAVTQTTPERSLDLLDAYRTSQAITKSNSKEFYWTTDMHHNTRGYDVMGRAIAAKVVQARLTDARMP